MLMLGPVGSQNSTLHTSIIKGFSSIKKTVSFDLCALFFEEETTRLYLYL